MSTTKEKWRFRTGFRGKLILQRRLEWIGHDSYGGTYDAAEWYDATAKDLLDYYNHVQRQTKET